jgi:hypothetical protein
MIALLAALLGAAEPVQVDLATLAEHAEQLDGREVEFEAYVARIDYPKALLLMAVPGEMLVLPDGGTVTGCSNDEEANFAMVPRSAIPASLRRKGGEMFIGVRVRAIFRNKPFVRRTHGVDLEWPGFFDKAVIEGFTGKSCLSHPPDGALPPPAK